MRYKMDEGMMDDIKRMMEREVKKRRRNYNDS